MNLAEILRRQVAARPDAVAIIDSGRRRSRFVTSARAEGVRYRQVSFLQLDQASACAASFLRQQGLRPGDAVLVFHPMSIELYVALLAIFRLQLIAMFLDPSAGREHIERCCALHAPRAVIASSKAHLLRLWSKALRRIPLQFAIGLPVPGAICWSRAEAGPAYEEIAPCEPDTPALLTFTSGSTGQPKAAVRTHGLLLAQHAALEQSLELTPGEVDLTTLPIVLLANLASGVTSVIPDVDLRYPGSIDAARVQKQIALHQVVSSTASPAFFECLTRAGQHQGTIYPSLKKLFSGGAPVFPRLLDQLASIAPDARIVALYGSTEAEPIAHMARSEMRPEDLKSMLRGGGLLTGPPIAEIQLQILRDQWGKPIGPFTEEALRDACQPAGVPGEIVVTGHHVLKGYLGGRGDEETKFRVQDTVWHRTGDAGYLDAEGRLWLLGRCTARLTDARGILYPFAVETAVTQDARVRRSALVGYQGRRLLAIEFDGQTAANVASLKELLGWAQLDDICVCRQIPVDKRHNAKVDYPALYRMLETTGRRAAK
jgi:acyl-CoA synthetase (AMP-forming)/AMP-acid ligase II